MRRRPTPEAKVLRAKLGKRLNKTIIDDVVAGKLDTTAGNLDMDEIEQACRPIIFEVLPQQHQPHEPAEAFRMCVDIIRKRRKYIQGKAKAKVTVKKEKLTVKQEKDDFTLEQEKDDFTLEHVQALFSSQEQESQEQESQEQEDEDRSPAAPTPTIKCLGCPKTITLDEAFPESARATGDLVMARCKTCYDKEDDSNVSEDLCAQQARLNEKKRLALIKEKRQVAIAKKAAKKGKKAGSKNAAKKGKKAGWKFDLYANVMCQWPDSGYFIANIFARSKGKYHVYFPDDRKVLRNVEEKFLRAPSSTSKWGKVTRTDVLGHSFMHMIKKDASHPPGTPKCKGEFVVEALGTGRAINKYVCKRVSGINKKTNKKGKNFHFDVGYVMSSYVDAVFPLD